MRAFTLDLDAATPVTAPGTLQVGTATRNRVPQLDEIKTLLVTALATTGLLTPVRTVNAQAPDGTPLALAVFEGARFDQDASGNTQITTQ